MRRATLVLCTVALALPARSAAAEQALTLTRPLQRQIVQRDAHGDGRVPVAGKVDRPADRIEARVRLLPGGKGHETDWQPVAGTADIKDGAFHGALQVRQGGWYVVEVRARAGDEVVAEGRVPKVGVGEVIITAGQSNSANAGDTRQVPKDDRVSAWDGKAWRLARDPQPIATEEGGTPWPVLGDLLVERLQVPVGFVSVGWGGSFVQQWEPGGKMYPRLKNALTQMGKHGARCVLWHQGESDTLLGTPADVYARRLSHVIRQSRADAGYDIVWFVAGVSFVNQKRANEAAVRQGQRMVCDGKLTFAGPTTDDMLGSYRSRVNPVHFSDLGLKEHGRRWAEVLSQTLYGGAERRTGNHR